MLYLLEEQDRIVGISGFTVRPPEARKEKPKVSTFLDANIDEILDFKPDLVIGFSDIQANIAQQLISEGVTVWVNNHRSVRGIMEMMVQLGALVGKQAEAIEIVDRFKNRVGKLQEIISKWEIRPKVYFEEWYDPLITGIQWVEELIELAGGQDTFPELREKSLAKDRILADPSEVIRRNPDIIIASWCGKMFKKDKMLSREGWNQIPAVQNDDLYEVDSSIILQPGPASLTEGLEELHRIISNWIEKQNS